MPRPVPKKLIFVVLCFAAIGLLSVIGCGVDCIIFKNPQPKISYMNTNKHSNMAYQKHEKKALIVSTQYNCPYSKDNAKCQNWYSKQDIMVQNKSLYLNKLLLIATCVGIILVGFTLWQTQIAVKTANNANAITKEGFEKQLRAYLNVESITFEPDPLPQWDREYLFSFNIKIKNFGQTPAHQIKILGKVTLERYGLEKIHSKKETIIGFIGAGSKKTCMIGFNPRIPKGIESDSKTFDIILDLKIEHIGEFSDTRTTICRYVGVTNEKYMTLVERSIRQVDSRNVENC